jgi:hypothetical protein
MTHFSINSGLDCATKTPIMFGMGLYVSTTGTDVTISELGIVITHPTTDRNLIDQFSSDELAKADSLTAAITSGSLVWKKVSGGSVQTPTDYDSDWTEVEELATGTGAAADHLVKVSDLSTIASSYQIDGGNATSNYGATSTIDGGGA